MISESSTEGQMPEAARAELLRLIESTKAVSVGLPTKFDWSTGHLDLQSAKFCLNAIIFPAFELANRIRIVGWKFGDTSFNGEGAMVLRKSSRAGSDLILEFDSTLQGCLERFFIDPSQGRGVPAELRGTIFFDFSIEDALKVSRIAGLEAPLVIKNMSVLFGRTAWSRVNRFRANEPGRVLAALSDRSDLTAIHFFGNLDSLTRLTNK